MSSCLPQSSAQNAKRPRPPDVGTVDDETHATTTTQPALAYMLAFVDAIKAGHPENDDDDESSDSPMSSKQTAILSRALQGLMAVLEQSSTDHGPVPASGGTTTSSSQRKRTRHLSDKYSLEIARILFPWALTRVQQLLTKKNTKADPVPAALCWRAWQLSLDRLSQDNTTPPPLTQSVLLQFIPRLIVTAIQQDDATTALGRNASRPEDDHHTKVVVVQPAVVAAHTLGVLLTRNDIFTPVLQQAVETVLIPLAQALQLSETYVQRRVLPTATTTTSHQMLVVTTALQWLHRRLRHHGNARTNFGVLAQPAVLLQLARWHLYVQRWPTARLLAEIPYDTVATGPHRRDVILSTLLAIVDQGLFRPHMDGWASWARNPTFATYQRGLVSNVIQVLSQNDSSDGNNRDMIWFLPVLLQRFGLAAQIWMTEQDRHAASLQRQSNKKKSKTTFSLAQLQFALVQHWIPPLVQVLVARRHKKKKDSVATVGLRALREIMDWVYQENAYLPALDDAQQSQFATLSTVVQLLREEPSVYPEASFGALEYYADALLLVTRLMQLNHLLWRKEEWPTVLRFSLQSTEPRIQDYVANLWRTATEIFTQLRQTSTWMDHLASVTLDVHERKDSDSTASAVLANVWSHASVQSVLATQIQSCPVKQIPSVFAALRKALSGGRDKTAESSSSMEGTQPLVELVLQNLPVHSGTASTVSLGLATLVKETVETGILSENGLTRQLHTAVYGCCMDLSLRCAFWLGPSAQVSVPPSIQAAMWNEQTTDELLLVMAHRLRQVSSLLHEAQLAQLMRTTTEETTADKGQVPVLKAEARGLAIRMYEKAACMPAGQGWKVLAQFFQFWFPFVELKHVDGLLGWIFNVLSVDSQVNERPPSEFMWTWTNLDGQQEVARSLLHDVAFYDTAVVSQRIRHAAVAVVAGWILLAICGDGKSERTDISSAKDDNDEVEITSKRVKHITDQRQSHADDVMSLTEGKFTRTFRAPSLIAPEIDSDRDKVEERLRCAIECIKIANGLPIRKVASSTCVLYSLLYLDRMVCDRYLNKADSRFYVVALSLSGSLRKAISEDLMADRVVPNPTQVLEFLSETIEKCSLPGLDESAIAPHSGTVAYLLVTGCLVELLLKSVVSVQDNNASLDFWLDQVMPDSVDSDDDDEKFGWTSYELVILLHTLRGFHQVERSHQIESFVAAVVPRLSECIQQIESPSWRNVMICKVIAEALMLGNRTENEELNAALMVFIIELCLNWVGNGMDNASYLQILATLLLAGSPLSEICAENILRVVTSLEPNYSMIPVIVRACVTNLSEASFSRFVNNLTDLTALRSKGMGTKLLLARLLFTENFSLKTRSDAIENECGGKLLDFALSCTFLVDDIDPRLVSVAVEVWIQAIQDFSIEREKLVVLLGRIPAILTQGNKSTDLYSCCARLMSLLLQRYSKHLSGCAANVVLALQTFVRQITDLKLSTADLIVRARRWTRLCELMVPQKEIYKKHLVYVVFESVQAATDGDVKKALMPGWMHLLDTFSTSYEVKQLNALMQDVSTKMRFRPIYEEYRRYHKVGSR